MLWWLDYSTSKHHPNSVSSRFCFPLNVMCFVVVNHCVFSVCLVVDFGSFQWPLFVLSAEIYTGYSMSCDSVTCLCCYPCLLFLHELICPFALSLDVLSSEHIIVSAHHLSASAETITPIQLLSAASMSMIPLDLLSYIKYLFGEQQW